MPADSGTLTAEVDSWLDRRTPEQAAAELAAAVAELAEPSLQYLALAMLTDLGPELAVPHVRQLAENPASRGFALCWLADNGMLEVQALYDSGNPDSFAQVLFQRLVMTDPAGMLGTLALAGDDDRQARLATELGLLPAPSAEIRAGSDRRPPPGQARRQGGPQGPVPAALASRRAPSVMAFAGSRIARAAGKQPPGCQGAPRSRPIL